MIPMPPVRTRGYAHHVEIAAPVAQVWQALTVAPLIVRWYGARAIVEPRVGGRFFVERAERGARDAQIDVFEPNRRLRLVYLRVPGAPHSDTALVDDFLLDRRGPATVLRVLGSGVPDTPDWDALYMRLRLGWPILLRELRGLLEGGGEHNGKAAGEGRKGDPPKDPARRGR
jgi:uncharacterized protein YndB with AHSA1/START domain